MSTLTSRTALQNPDRVGKDIREYMEVVCAWHVPLLLERAVSMEIVSDRKTRDEGKWEVGFPM